MDYLNGFFEQYGYITGYAPVYMEPGRTVWRESDGPYADLLEQYRANVAKLRAVLTLRPDTPAVPADMAGLTTEEANNIEKILIEIDTIIGWLEASFDRSHAYTFWSGSDPLPSAESDLGRIWAELDAMNTTWNNWQAADFYLLLYGNLKAEGDVA